MGTGVITTGLDNVTHTLIGVTLARAFTSPATPPGARRAATWTAVVASNLPDLDFIAPWILGGGNLTYLLHHRGYTHTLAAVPIMALLSAWIGWRAGGRERPERIPLFLLALVATLLHVTADAGNNYGVHPFSPVWNGWFYGDFLFIVEPLVWMAMLPLAFAGATHRGRILAGTVGIAALGLVWFGPFLSWSIAGLVSVWLVVMAAIQWRAGVRAGPAMAATVLVMATFAIGSTMTRAAIETEMAAAAGSERVRAISIRPAPSNPFCWDLLVATTSEEDYIVRAGGATLAPRLFDPQKCLLSRPANRTAPMEPASLHDSDWLRWTAEYRAPAGTLVALSKDSCHMAALLRFTRVPYWMERGAETVSGDLRYDFREGLDFAEISFNGSDPCPRFVPPWIPPLLLPLR